MAEFAEEKISGSRNVSEGNASIPKSLKCVQTNAVVTHAGMLSAKMDALVQTYGK